MVKKPSHQAIPQQDVVETKSYNALGHIAPLRSPQTRTARVHLRAGKGGGAKSAGTTVHADILRNAGATIVWPDPTGKLPEREGEGATFTLFDLETANPTLGRYYPDLPGHQRCGTLNSHEMGDLLLQKILPLAQHGCTVLVDLGSQGEVPLLDFVESNDLSHLLGETFVWHVPIGSLDSIGTATSIAERSPATPVILYLLHKEPELGMVLQDEFARGHFNALLDLANVVGVLDFPDLRTAFSTVSRASRTLLDVLAYEKLNVFEKQICRVALTRLQDAWHPATAWLSC